MKIAKDNGCQAIFCKIFTDGARSYRKADGQSEIGGNEKKNDVLLPVAEACEIVKLSKPFLYDMLNPGELPCIEIGKRKQKTPLEN